MRYSTFFVLLMICASQSSAADPIDIDSRLELFVDDFLIAELTGDARQTLHQPTPREVVLRTDESWEGNTCAYYTIFQDDDVYRMYYRGSHADEKTLKGLHPEVTCYAESRDGIHWMKPKLGIVEWNGSKDNNIIIDGIGAHCFVAFRDANPGCPADARYKGISRGRPNGKKGLFVFKSPDGIHWSLIKNEPVITVGAFDSQNLAFWDSHTRRYVGYHRNFTAGVRSIMTSTSADFVSWTDPVQLKYAEGTPNQHLYTNAIRPYFRAPHIRIGFPTRYIPKGSQVEPIFMSSRDGVTFRRWNDPVIPMSAPKDRDGNRSNYMASGLLSLPGNDREFAVYGTEAYYAGPDSRLRRFMYRVDGFVSVHADKIGDLITKPLKFSGNELVVNYAARKGGSVRIEIQDADGNAKPGFDLSSANKLTGDEIVQVVSWKRGSNVTSLAGKSIRLQVSLSNADLYSIRFRSK